MLAFLVEEDGGGGDCWWQLEEPIKFELSRVWGQPTMIFIIALNWVVYLHLANFQSNLHL